jgi:hypothetical protein
VWPAVGERLKPRGVRVTNRQPRRSVSGMARAIVHAELREDVARYRRSEAVVTDQADAQCAQTDAVLRERDATFDESCDFFAISRWRGPCPCAR